MSDLRAPDVSLVRRDFPIGTPRKRAGILTFIVEAVPVHDVATVLDRASVAARARHHGCQPLMARLGVPATVRTSCVIYNTCAEIDARGRTRGRAEDPAALVGVRQFPMRVKCAVLPWQALRAVVDHPRRDESGK